MDILIKRSGETRILDVDCTLELADGVTLSSVTAIAADTITGVASPTLDNAVINAAPVTYDWGTADIGKAIQFRAAGGVAGYEYTVRITCATSDGGVYIAVFQLAVDDR